MLALALLAFYTGPLSANSYNGSNEILSVGLHDSGHVLITLAASSNTEACATPSFKNAILIPKTNPNFKLMYATALAAFTTGRPIQGWVNGCTDVWGSGSLMVATATTIFISK